MRDNIADIPRQPAPEPTAVECPDCGAAVEVPDQAAVGDVFDCQSCGAELEVISLEPLTLDLFEEEEK
jgi:alpha-aminoadipate carrier protein LysW